MKDSLIRNFAIIAHIDHGKSTLADRLMEITGLVKKGDHAEQLLDTNPISRERGITIKLAPVTMKYKLSNPNIEIRNNKKSEIHNSQSVIRNQDSEYILNLVDTPGHVDFSYEVERTLACVEGVVLLVDATQGIQAQTIAHAYKALEMNLKIIPVINKIDRPEAEVEKCVAELSDFLGVAEKEVYKISAKTGAGVEELLRGVIEKIPGPLINPDTNTKALIFDSYYDPHKGVIAFVRVFDNKIEKGDQLELYASKTKFESLDVGIFKLNLEIKSEIGSGQIGYVVTNLKRIHLVRVGDTIINNNKTTPLPGYKKINPVVHAHIFTTDAADYPNLEKSLEKLYLNDASLEFEPIYSQTLGPGLRVGFLGLLHADVVRERLEREFGQSLVLTPSRVDFKIINNEYWEPYAKVNIITPTTELSNVLKLCQSYRAVLLSTNNVSLGSQVMLTYEFPMSELMSNFYDKLKSVSSGYASLDWEYIEHRRVNAERLEIMINNDVVEEFSEIVVAERADTRARTIVDKLKEIIPRQMFEVRIQARYKGRILASNRVAPFRKDVTAKLYGGDRSRKDKLLKKQKKGKKLMKQIGKIEIPKESFIKLFKSN